MPFTLSHPALVIPIARRPLVPSALVMGSVCPDLPYFFGGKLRWLTHLPLGVVTIDVGFALALLAVFHLVLKWPLVALCPPWVRSRLVIPARAFDERTMNDLGWVMVSAVLGAAGHVLWDEFTHGDGHAVRRLSWLADPLLGGPPGYRVAQYASGLIGALVIGLWTARWLRHAPAVTAAPPGLSHRARARVLVAAITGGAAGAGYGATVWLPVGRPPIDVNTRVVGGVVGATSAVALTLLVYALCLLVAPAVSRGDAGGAAGGAVPGPPATSGETDTSDVGEAYAVASTRHDDRGTRGRADHSGA